MRNYDYIRMTFYKSYSNEELCRELSNFVNQDMDLSTGFSSKGKSTTKLISHFFDRDIYAATNRRGSTPPSDAIMDDGLLDRIFEYIDSKPTFYTGDDIQNLKSFFRNAGKWSCKVAAFSPNTARKIYETFCPKENANILDYSCGFGGRMLGAVSPKYNYNYFGIDPNTKLFKSLNKFGEFININRKFNYKLYCQGSENEIPELIDQMDFAFSSPPYFDLETYNQEETQSIVKFPKYDQWLKKYVEPTIKNIHKYLKKECLFAINIKNFTHKKGFNLLDDWKSIALNNGFELIGTYDMSHQSVKLALKNFQKENGIKEHNGEKEPLVLFKKVLDI